MTGTGPAVPLDEHGHAYPGDLTDHREPAHTDSLDGACIDCAEVDPRGLDRSETPPVVMTDRPDSGPAH